MNLEDNWISIYKSSSTSSTYLIKLICPKNSYWKKNGYTLIYYGFLLFSASNGVVLATEKKQKSILYDEQSVHKVEPITKHIGMVYSGMGPDYRFVFGLYAAINNTIISLSV